MIAIASGSTSTSKLYRVFSSISAIHLATFETGCPLKRSACWQFLALTITSTGPSVTNSPVTTPIAPGGREGRTRRRQSPNRSRSGFDSVADRGGLDPDG